MRKDTKTGMIIGAVFCFAAVIWFCASRQDIRRPEINIRVSDYQTDSRDVVSFDSDLSIQQDNNNVDIAAASSAIIHTVLAGQTLSDISKLYYGTGSKWKIIYEANADKFRSGPNSLRPGTKLLIPQQEAR